MITVRIPSALRPYADGQKEVTLDAVSVDHALEVLTERFPALNPHLYDETETLRQYVNLFVNEQDVRSLQGGATPLTAGDRMMIVPSIAGGVDAAPLQSVDHATRRVSQAIIIVLLLAAYVLNVIWLLAAVAATLTIGALASRPSFRPIYGEL